AHLAGRDGVAHSHGDVADGADVAHRRVAGVEHQAAIDDGIDGSRLDRAAIDLLEAAEAAVDEVHVAIDEAREQGASTEIDDEPVSARLAIGRHRANPCDPTLAHPNEAPLDWLVGGTVYEARVDENALGCAGDERIALGFLHGRPASVRPQRASFRPSGSSSHLATSKSAPNIRRSGARAISRPA